MPHDPQQVPPLFRIDVSADSANSANHNPSATSISPSQLGAEMVNLLRELLDAQERQTELLEEVSQQLTAAQKQRASELVQWKEANPSLARNCRQAVETLSRMQTQFLENLTEEVKDNEDCLVDGDFMMNEFVDRFGPRLAHLNGVLQVLSQLSTPVNVG